MLLLRGILAVVFGLLCVAYPNVTLLVIKIMFGTYALVDGIFALASSLSTAKGTPPWWSTILEGIVGIILGLLILIWPDITGFTLLYLIGAWAVITGIFEIIAAIRLRQARWRWCVDRNICDCFRYVLRRAVRLRRRVARQTAVRSA